MCQICLHQIGWHPKFGRRAPWETLQPTEEFLDFNWIFEIGERADAVFGFPTQCLRAVSPASVNNPISSKDLIREEKEDDLLAHHISSLLKALLSHSPRIKVYAEQMSFESERASSPSLWSFSAMST